MTWPSKSHPLGWMLFLTVLGWAFGAGAEENPPTSPSLQPLPPPAESSLDQALGGFTELLASGWLAFGESLSSRPFLGKVSSNGIRTDDIRLWRTPRLTLVAIVVINPEGAEPWEPAPDGAIVWGEGDVEVGRLPVRLVGTRLLPGHTSLLLVACPQPAPAAHAKLEVRARDGQRSIHVERVWP